MGIYSINSLNHNRSALILDDHYLFAESFSKLLESSTFFHSVHYFSSPDELVEYLLSHRSTRTFYLFLDYYLKEKTILSVINDLRRIYKNTKMIIVSGTNTPTIIAGLIEYNVDAILHKSSSMHEVIDCLHALDSGKTFYSTDIVDIIKTLNEKEHTKQLTEREIEILEYFSRGLTVDETAKAMYLSRHTIAAHRRKMFLKTNSNNIIELLSYARKFDLF